MGAETKIVLPVIETLADAMDAEDVHQIRDWRRIGGRMAAFTVELWDGRKGAGHTPREAIEDARAKPVKVAA